MSQPYCRHSVRFVAAAFFATASGAAPLAGQETKPVTPAEETKSKPATAIDPKAVQLDKVEVTDQSVKPFTTGNVDIPRTINDVQPYFMFDASTIERSGATTVENFLRQRLTMNATQTVQEQSFFQGGVPSSVNLRGLGSNQTLILINGRRASGGNSSGSASAQIDINGIPVGAVDRIEVLTASGSAIYGASAVGGVINIVLKRNYSGGEVRHTYQNTFDSDTPIRRTDFTYGFSLGKGKTQVMLTSSYADTAILELQDRADFLVPYNLQVLRNSPSYVGYLILGSTPNIVGSPAPGTILTLKNGGGSLNANSTYIPAGTSPSTSTATLAAGLLANAGKLNLEPAQTTAIKGARAPMGTPSATKNYRVSVRHELSPKIELFTDFSYNAVSTDKNFGIAYSLSVPAAAPTNPFNQAVNMHVPFTNVFPGSTLALSRQLTTGFNAKLPYDWVANADYTWSYGYNSFRSAGIGFNSTELSAAILAGTVNPFVDIAKYPLSMEKYLSYNVFSGYSTMNDVNLRLSGPVWHLPAGIPQLTIGLGARREGTPNSDNFVEVPAFPNRSTQTLNLGKKQTTESLYLETEIPIISPKNKLWFAHEFNVQLAGRLEDFRVNTGTASIAITPAPATPPVILKNKARYKSTQPTAGFSYKPVDGVMFRASYAGGFVPPTFSQLLLNPVPSTTFTTVTDPRRGNTSRLVQTLSGGNPALEPETSKSWNAGLVIEPKQIGLLKGLRFNVEFYSIEKRNNIGSLAAQIMVESESIFPGRVIRDPVPAGDPYAVGPITLVDLKSMNLYKAFNEGYDISVSYRRQTGSYGSFDFTFLTSLPTHYKRKTALNQPYLDYVNYPGSGPLAFRYNTTLVWDYRQWNLGWTTSYYGKSKVFGPPVSTSTTSIDAQGSATTPSQMYHDMFVGYRFDADNMSKRVPSVMVRALKGVDIQISILDVFNKEPPFELGATSYWYSTWGSLRLREYKLSIKKAF